MMKNTKRSLAQYKNQFALRSKIIYPTANLSHTRIFFSAFLHAKLDWIISLIARVIEGDYRDGGSFRVERNPDANFNTMFLISILYGKAPL